MKQLVSIQTRDDGRKFDAANAVMQACLALTDKAETAVIQIKDPDPYLSERRRLAQSIPADASDAHAQLFDHFANGSFVARSDRITGQLALNPSHRVHNHWDSTETRPEMCHGLVHGGHLVLNGSNGREHYFLAGGVCHFLGGRVRRKEAKISINSGLGLTVQKVVGGKMQEVLSTEVTSKASLFFFHKGLWVGFERAIKSAQDPNFSGFYARHDEAFNLRHLVKTREIAHFYKIVDKNPGATRPLPATFSGRTNDFCRFDRTAIPGSFPYSLPRGASTPDDPFSIWYKPVFDDDPVLHRTPYLRVVSPSPDGPALITYLAGVHQVSLAATRNHRRTWRGGVIKHACTTRMALIG